MGVERMGGGGIDGLQFNPQTGDPRLHAPFNSVALLITGSCLLAGPLIRKISVAVGLLISDYLRSAKPGTVSPEWVAERQATGSGVPDTQR